MEINKNLDKLFEEWERNSNLDYKGKFIKDGVIDESLYVKAKLKVLFIEKESNDPEQTSWDYRKWWKEELKYPFTYRIAEWSYGLLNNFPPYDKIWEKENLAHNALKHIAFMNIKKSGGGGSSNYNIMDEHLNDNYKYLHKEIEIISPEIIILGLTWNHLRNKLFPEIKWEKSGYNVFIGKFKNIKVIDFYHPSSRNVPAAAYSLLQNVVNSSAFKNL
jgi:hypothetical protein